MIESPALDSLSDIFVYSDSLKLFQLGGVNEVNLCRLVDSIIKGRRQLETRKNQQKTRFNLISMSLEKKERK